MSSSKNRSYFKCITRVQIVNKGCWSCMATLTAWCVRHVEPMRQWSHRTESYRRWLVVIDAVVGSDRCSCWTWLNAGWNAGCAVCSNWQSVSASSCLFSLLDARLSSASSLFNSLSFKACLQGRSQPHSPGWARVPLSSFFPQISIKFFLFSLKLYSFSSSFWPFRWASRPPGKAQATPLPVSLQMLIVPVAFCVVLLL